MLLCIVPGHAALSVKKKQEAATAIAAATGALKGLFHYSKWEGRVS